MLKHITEFHFSLDYNWPQTTTDCSVSTSCTTWIILGIASTPDCLCLATLIFLLWCSLFPKIPVSLGIQVYKDKARFEFLFVISGHLSLWSSRVTTICSCIYRQWRDTERNCLSWWKGKMRAWHSEILEDSCWERWVRMWVWGLSTDISHVFIRLRRFWKMAVTLYFSQMEHGKKSVLMGRL